MWEHRMPRVVDYINDKQNNFYNIGNTLWYQIAIGMKLLDPKIAKQELKDYNLYEETGQSVVTGIDLDGDASWRQEFITIGLRSYDQEADPVPVYVELAYSIGKAEETITTETPEYTTLNSTWNNPDIRGGAIALGFKFIDFGMGFQFSGEIGYVHLPVTTTDDKEINIGGTQLSLGLTWGM